MHHLESELHDLKRQWLLMLNRAGIVLEWALQSVREGNLERADRAIIADAEVDHWQHELEGRCLELIGRRSLLARDLRFVSCVFASLSDLERVGDNAVHIAEEARVIAPDTMLDESSRLLRAMLFDLEAAIRDENTELTASVIDCDAEVDDVLEQLGRELTMRVLEQPAEIPRVLALTRASRCAGRIGDHLENVAERVRFWLTGER